MERPRQPKFKIGDEVEFTVTTHMASNDTRTYTVKDRGFVCSKQIVRVRRFDTNKVTYEYGITSDLPGDYYDGKPAFITLREEKLTLVGPAHQDGVPDENPPPADAPVTFHPLVLHNRTHADLTNKAYLSIMHSLRGAALVPGHSNRLIREILNVTWGGNPGWHFSPSAAPDNKPSCDEGAAPPDANEPADLASALDYTQKDALRRWVPFFVKNIMDHPVSMAELDKSLNLPWPAMPYPPAVPDGCAPPFVLRKPFLVSNDRNMHQDFCLEIRVFRLVSKESHEEAPDRGGSKNNISPESPKER